MSETALYRKYRPGKFKDVIGQDHIVDVLEGAIKQGNIAHAYLFSGSRGTGKTSIARILARELGCSSNDLYEIDAASNRGIDDVRELREAVRTLPFESEYKVYIVDEVHMLTKEAFNALLKTLEEPPHHVIFILATTELHKLPDTIVSRCQTFSFKKPSVEALKKYVNQIAKKEGMAIDEESANLIALLGDGSFRDTIGILQKVISFSKDSKITRNEVELITDAPKRDLVYDFIFALLDGEVGRPLRVIESVVKADRDMKFFLKMVLNSLRLAMLVKFAPEMKAEIKSEVGDDEFILIEKIKDHSRAQSLSAVLKELLFAYDEIGRSYLPQLPLELAVIRIVNALPVLHSDGK